MYLNTMIWKLKINLSKLQNAVIKIANFNFIKFLDYIKIINFLARVCKVQVCKYEMYSGRCIPFPFANLFVEVAVWLIIRI